MWRLPGSLTDCLVGLPFPLFFELTGPSASSGSTHTSCAATPSKQEPLGTDGEHIIGTTALHSYGFSLSLPPFL